MTSPIEALHALFPAVLIGCAFCVLAGLVAILRHLSEIHSTLGILRAELSARADERRRRWKRKNRE